MTKSVKSLTKNVKEHKQKLREFSKNPAKFDNQGRQANAPTEAIRKTTIADRKEVLRRQIKKIKMNLLKRKMH